MADQLAGPVISSRTVGSGKPTLLFVHGLGCALDDWDAQVGVFSTNHRCVAVDLPGHGRSAPAARGDIVSLAKAVNELRTTFDDAPVVLIGHSLGCKVIREVYSAAPQHVVGMVMIDGRHYGGQRDEQMAKFDAAMAASGYAGHMRRHFGEMFHPTTDQAVRDAITARALSLDPDYAASLLRDAITWDYERGEPTLSAIKVPVLALQSTHVDAQRKRRPIEQGIRTHFMDLVERLVPTATSEIVTGAGHFPMIECAEVINRRIGRFLAGL